MAQRPFNPLDPLERPRPICDRAPHPVFTPAPLSRCVHCDNLVLFHRAGYFYGPRRLGVDGAELREYIEDNSTRYVAPLSPYKRYRAEGCRRHFFTCPDSCYPAQASEDQPAPLSECSPETSLCRGVPLPPPALSKYDAGLATQPPTPVRALYRSGGEGRAGAAGDLGPLRTRDGYLLPARRNPSG